MSSNETISNIIVFPKIGVVKPPKWMVYFMENPIKMDDLGGFPIIFGGPPINILCVLFWEAAVHHDTTRPTLQVLFFTSMFDQDDIDAVFGLESWK